MNNFEKLELMNALENMVKSQRIILDFWYKYNDEINDILCEKYPFNQSFDEIGISTWVYTIEEKIWSVK